jgi:hypothetical protein
MMRGLRNFMLQRCAGWGDRCWCRSAATCRFKRCTNCDMPVDRYGIALLYDIPDVDHHSGPCPYCNGPMPKL